MITFTGLMLIVVSLFATAGTIYKKVNQDGSVSYSDQPFPGSQIVEVTVRQQTQLPTVRSSIRSSSNKPVLTDYAISIQSPISEQTIRNNSGDLTIMVQTTPAANPKLRVQILVNNTPYLKPSQGTVFKLKNIDRGELKIKAQLLSTSGQVLATSSETLVYLHRATAR